MDVDSVVLRSAPRQLRSLGQTSGLTRSTKARLHRHRREFATSIAGVYAGGDIVTGAATVIQAHGRRAPPRAMKAWLRAARHRRWFTPPDACACARLFGFDRRRARLREECTPISWSLRPSPCGQWPPSPVHRLSREAPSLADIVEGHQRDSGDAPTLAASPSAPSRRLRQRHLDHRDHRRRSSRRRWQCRGSLGHPASRIGTKLTNGGDGRISWWRST